MTDDLRQKLAEYDAENAALDPQALNYFDRLHELAIRGAGLLEELRKVVQ